MRLVRPLIVAAIPPASLGDCRKVAAIAERGRRDRGDERVIVQLSHKDAGPIDPRCGVARVVAGPSEEIELSGGH